MGQLKLRWLMVGLAAMTLTGAGCARQRYYAEGDPNTQPSVEADGVYFESKPAVAQSPAAESGSALAPSGGTPIGIVSQAEATPVAASVPLDVPTPPPATGPAENKVKVYQTSQKWLDNNPEPSLKGLDRSGWEPTVFMTDSGTVEHYNMYHRDLPTGYEKRHDENLRRANNGDATAVLDGYKTEWFNKDNSRETFTQPGKFAFDTVVMFPMLFVHPFWGKDYTPRKETVGVAVKEKPADITKVPPQPVQEEAKQTLPQLPAWPTDAAPAKPVAPLNLDPQQNTIPPLDFDNSPGM
jgi:hypothetical protein